MKKILLIALASALMCSAAFAASGDGTSVTYITTTTNIVYCPYYTSDFSFSQTNPNQPYGSGTITGKNSKGNTFVTARHDLAWSNPSTPSIVSAPAYLSVPATATNRNIVGYIANGVIRCDYTYYSQENPLNHSKIYRIVLVGHLTTK